MMMLNYSLFTIIMNDDGLKMHTTPVRVSLKIFFFCQLDNLVSSETNWLSYFHIHSLSTTRVSGQMIKMEGYPSKNIAKQRISTVVL